MLPDASPHHRPLDEATSAEWRARYDTTDDPEDRLRYQIGWLAHLGQRVVQIAPAVLRSPDTVRRVLHRYQDGGRAALPRRTAPGPARTVTPAWEAELVRVIERDPPAGGVATATGTTGRLATSLAEPTGIAVSDETGRQYLVAHAYVGKRPTWPLQRRASDQDGHLGNA